MHLGPESAQSHFGRPQDLWTIEVLDEIELEDDDQMEELDDMRGVLEWNRDRTSVGFDDGPAMLMDRAGPAVLMDARREDLHRAM